MAKKIYRQGDVLLIKVPKTRIKDAKPVARDNGRVILAYGEVTGHAHAIDDKDAEQLQGTDALTTRFLQVLGEGGVDLVHEEHDTIKVPPGVYEVRGQREAAVENPQMTRRVLD